MRDRLIGQKRGFRQIVEMNGRSVELGYNPIEELRGMIGNQGVNTHLHLDRAHSLSREAFADSNIPLQEKWDYVNGIKVASTVDQIFDRMAYAAEEMLLRGVYTIGTFIDVDQYIQDKAILAAVRLREEFRGDATFVFQNQTLQGVLNSEARMWFDRGAEFVDHIGGLPGKDDKDPAGHLDIVLGTAKVLGKKAFVHVDQFNNPFEQETELLLQKTMEHRMQGRVVAIHGISLGAQSKQYLDWIIPQLAAADIQFICCPRAWIDSGRHDDWTAPIHTPITPVDLLIKGGVTVAIGTDNTNDIYKPGAPSDIIPELELVYECCRVRDLKTLTDIGTVNGLKVLGIDSQMNKMRTNGHVPLPMFQMGGE
jgi:cytosine/creatinine deaminase